MYKRDVLEDGMRVVTEMMDSVKSISLGIWVNVGSRDESAETHGISHLIEHMIFKGTEKRSTKDIALTIDALGGSADAFTSKESTCYYVKFLDKDIETALDLLLDILNNSKFDEAELKKEKNVIEEEIKTFNDSPDEFVFELFFNALYPGHPMAKSILGTKESIRSMDRKSILTYINKQYTLDRIIVAAAGNVDHNYLVSLVKDRFNFSKNGKGRSKEKFAKQKKFNLSEKKGISQAHVMVGLRIFPYADSRRYTLLVLNELVGGGMSSRLFQRVREREGVVYTIYSFAGLYEDTGVFGIYFATDPKKSRKSLGMIYDEISKFHKDGITEKELTNAKSHLLGNLMLSLESTSSRMIRLAKEEMYLKRHISLDETISAIENVKKDDVLHLGCEILKVEDFSSSVVRPPKGIKKFF